MKDLARIPSELKQLQGWVCANSDKVPFHPTTQRLADPANPASGGTFEEAVAADMPHVGFILSNDDPYCIIDLDDPFEVVRAGEKIRVTELDPEYAECLKIAQRHNIIYHNTISYAERSQSGNGVHIVCLGFVPKGARRDKIEVYSNERYIIFTGDVLNDVPIVRCQEQITELYEKIGNYVIGKNILVEEDPIEEDATLWKRASRAENGEKFIALCEGKWQELGYTSQSEADHGLLSMLCFYTRSNEQARQMFYQTKLYRGNYQKNKGEAYLNYSITRIRKKAERDERQTLNFCDLKDSRRPVSVTPIEDVPVLHKTALQVKHEKKSIVQFPEGLLGEVASFIYLNAPRPVPEIALAGALTLLAGIGGRSYYYNGVGMNLYTILLAKTGTGKEGAASGMDKLLSVLGQTVPAVNDMRGPSAFASAQGIMRTLAKSPCTFSVLGEFGLTLKALCDARAQERHTAIRQVLLDIYSKNSPGSTLYGVSYSDQAKNMPSVRSPSLTLLGESTPHAFFDGLEDVHIAQGLIPRFLFISYDGKRVPLSENRITEPSPELITKLGQYASHCLTVGLNNEHVVVSATDTAKAALKEQEETLDAIINNNRSDEVTIQLWNRVGLQTIKVSTLLAVCRNFQNPIIHSEDVEWAKGLVTRDIHKILEVFRSGDSGRSDDLTKEYLVCKQFSRFCAMSADEKYSRGLKTTVDSSEYNLVPFPYLRELRNRKAFESSRLGSTASLRNTVEELCKDGVLRRLTKEEGASYGIPKGDTVYTTGRHWQPVE